MVTGGLGFVGQRLVETLVERGAEQVEFQSGQSCRYFELRLMDEIPFPTMWDGAKTRRK